MSKLSKKDGSYWSGLCSYEEYGGEGVPRKSNSVVADVELDSAAGGKENVFTELFHLGTSLVG